MQPDKEGGAIEDRELVERVRAGEKEAYAALVRRHQDKVRGLCLSMLGSLSAAEDAAQDVFVKAYERLAAFRGEAAFSTWLYRIASNHCLDLLRSEARRKSDSWDALLEDQGARVKSLFSEKPQRRLEDADLIGRVLAQLPPRYRAILTLREAEGLNYKEIAECLGCSVDGVKAGLRRARLALREKARHFLKAENV